MIQDILNENPKLELLGRNKFTEVMRDKGIATKDIKEWLSKSALHETYRVPKKLPMFKIVGSQESFQIDVIEMPYKSSGYSKFLMLVNIPSRKMWAYPIKTGTVKDVLDAYIGFLRDVDGKVSSLTGDDFFSANDFVNFNEPKGIKLYTDIAKEDHISKGDRLGVLDRAVRTIKGWLQKQMLLDDTTNWKQYLADIINMYNETPHSALKGKSPNEVFVSERLQNKLE